MAAVCVHHYHSGGETQTYTEGYYYQGTAVMVNNQFSTSAYVLWLDYTLYTRAPSHVHKFNPHPFIRPTDVMERQMRALPPAMGLYRQEATTAQLCPASATE